MALVCNQKETNEETFFLALRREQTGLEMQTPCGELAGRAGRKLLLF